MKAIIVSVLSVIAAAVALAVPVGATNGTGYVGGNASLSGSGYSRIGIKDGKIIFEGVSVTCTKSNFVAGGMFSSGTQVQQSQAVLPSADTSDCNAGQVTNNPPANATVTINGVCGDPAELAKIVQAHANLVINSVGPCSTSGKPAQPATVIVNNNTSAAPAKTASATTTTSTPAASTDAVVLPQTGISLLAPIAVAAMAGLTYAGVMIARRNRA